MSIRNMVAKALFVLSLTASAFAGTWTFPSPSSSVVGSVGHFGSEVGRFWSASRGDSVVETFADPLAAVSQLDLALNVTDNVLASTLNWDVRLNGNTVGSFSVNPGFFGSLNLSFVFSPIASPNSYTVGLFVTNSVGGSMALGSGGSNSATLVGASPAVPEPSSFMLMTAGSAGLLGLLRRRRS